MYKLDKAIIYIYIIYMTLDHKTSHKGQLFYIYTSLLNK